ncbi:hypothetical protein AB1Y20_000813 [Prymnesium parvum]|uniref:Glycosyltransferase 61 catalytic domain-containing protein n=1 Tax=Prymnesium parvum TaxID=97485 RepID=A0AB34KBI0_PRYPA
MATIRRRSLHLVCATALAHSHSSRGNQAARGARPSRRSLPAPPTRSCTASEPGCCRRHPRLCRSPPPPPPVLRLPHATPHAPPPPRRRPAHASAAPRGGAAAPRGGAAPLAPNVARVARVCFFQRRAHQHSRADPSEVELRVWRGRNHSVQPLCRALTRCHKPEAFALCRARGDAPLAEAFLGKACSFHVSAAAHDAPFPPAEARVVGRAALIRMTGNIGHDMFLESFLDFYAQQVPRTGTEGRCVVVPLGSVRTASPFFDALVLEAFWFKGQYGWDRARAEPSKSWSFTMLEALFGRPEVHVAAHYKMRMMRDRPPVTELPEHGLCVHELYVRAKLEAGHAAWGNIPRVPAMAQRILRFLGLPNSSSEPGILTAARTHPRSNQSLADNSTARVVLFTRQDAASRRLHLGSRRAQQRTLAKLGVTHLVHELPQEDIRAQVSLFLHADVLIAPHGASSANVLFMRPGSTFIELTPFCDETCLAGCYSAYTTAGVNADRLGILQALQMPPAAACRLVRSVYPPFHAYTGVRYHVLPLCQQMKPSSALLCGGMKGYKHEESLAKLNFNSSTIDRIREIVVRATINGSVRISTSSLPSLIQNISSSSTQLAPFGYSCTRAAL